MYIAYLIVTALAAAANIFSAGCDFVRYKQVSIAMARAGVPDSWMTTLGILKAAGALGLLVGIGVPIIGTAAAAGLVGTRAAQQKAAVPFAPREVSSAEVHD